MQLVKEGKVKFELEAFLGASGESRGVSFRLVGKFDLLIDAREGDDLLGGADKLKTALKDCVSVKLLSYGIVEDAILCGLHC